ncbi:hypothetical protein [Chryseobacterium sp. Mn2064]|uniref:hypothetical protein n=1 Tax=Chryseobacterium sp. Mn2064 TaxID=3395263 RepID=UPI003BE46712
MEKIFTGRNFQRCFKRRWNYLDGGQNVNGILFCFQKVNHIKKSQLIDAPFVSFIAQGKLHRVRPIIKDGKCDIWALRFKREFIAETVFQLYTSYHEKANICLKTDA